MKNILKILILFPLIVFAQKNQEIIKYEKDGFNIEYPSNWIINDSGENGTEFFIYPKKSETSDIFTENINLTKQNLNDPTVTIEIYRNIIENQIGSMLTDHKIILSEIENKNEIKFHKLFAEGDSSGHKFNTVVYSWLINKQIYSLTFITLNDNYEKNKTESLRIMDTFKLIKN